MLDVQTNLVKVLIITGVHIVTSKKTWKVSKSHFMLILQTVIILVRLTG